MDLGLDSREAMSALYTSLDTIAVIEERVDQHLPGDPGQLGEPGSQIEALLRELRDPPVDIRLTMLQAVASARSSLSQVRTLIVEGLPTSPQVLATLCRTALMASCRLTFIVGPASEEDRRINATRILLQESKSLQRCYSHAMAFTKLHRLVPPAEVLINQNRRHAQLKATVKPVTESDLLTASAEIIADLLRSKGHVNNDMFKTVLAEHYQWIFNIYSGVAHGFAWTGLVPGTGSMPGDFSADLWATVCAAQIAIDRLENAHKGQQG